MLHGKHTTAFEEVFGTEAERVKFWRSYLKDPEFSDHPQSHFVQKHMDLSVPLRLHGDDMPIRKGLLSISANCVSFGSPVTATCSARSSIILTCCILQRNLLDISFNSVYRVVCWSLTVLSEGLWPHVDHLGVPWKDEHRRQMAGRPLAPTATGYLRTVFLEAVGDWKFLREAWQLREHYGVRSCCHLCSAQKVPGPDSYADFREEAWAYRRRRTHQ